ncbi:MAG: LamG-like jellyroll fold domain-containing protein [Acidimicrobiales bacterium]
MVDPGNHGVIDRQPLTRPERSIVDQAPGSNLVDPDLDLRSGYPRRGPICSVWPEASIFLNNDGLLDDWVHARPVPEGEWHHIAMTWSGYPSGTVQIFLDGQPVQSRQYDEQSDNGLPLPRSYSVGVRPGAWAIEGGLFADSTAGGSMRMSSSGIEFTTPRLYDLPITSSELSTDRTTSAPE